MHRFGGTFVFSIVAKEVGLSSEKDRRVYYNGEIRLFLDRRDSRNFLFHPTNRVLFITVYIFFFLFSFSRLSHFHFPCS